MDLRTQKTEKAIINSFIKLRSKKPLNKITVTELSKNAMISKATFYLHYEDIYDLSEKLQNRLVSDIINEIPNPEYIITDPGEYSKSLFEAFASNTTLTDILFPESERNLLADRIETHIKSDFYKMRPELLNNTETDIALSMLIHGAFHAFRNHMRNNPKEAIEYIGKISKLLTDTLFSEIQKGIRKPE